jgi:hypothetical protein
MAKHIIWATKLGEYFAESIEIQNSALEIFNNPPPVLPDIDAYKQNLFSSIKEGNIFLDWVFSKCEDYCSDINLADNFIVTRGWAIALNYGNSNDFHTHGYTHLAAVYYIQADKTIHPDLEIIDPRPPHILSRITRNSNTTSDNTQISSGLITYKVPAETGKLVIIPGYLAHGVMTNMSHIPRVCLAMNINIKQ